MKKKVFTIVSTTALFSASLMFTGLNPTSINAEALTKQQQVQVEKLSQPNQTIRDAVALLGSYSYNYQDEYLSSLGTDSTYILSTGHGFRGFDLTYPYFDKNEYEKLKTNPNAATIGSIRLALKNVQIKQYNHSSDN
ncbi:hypothetical protein [Leuconostoc suionicum]|uniref:hypothetical protein n=1 Tax=Leuconostoc suionicum TaxID=1511761 RepID=UPI000909AA2A|nr:hypothetical protein [Leuconostoc suionicum]API72031.1 hypothetical protein A6B45_04820 [Leuconostoc suionicum]MBE4728046.1 hypothetical protein [Leuconostoc suionicum]BAX70642.1 carbon-nitrogen hydrolase [Leuconostoc suionicum]